MPFVAEFRGHKVKAEVNNMSIKFGHVIATCAILCGTSLVMAQQKGQYVPGQYGLNAGVTPDPGFTFGSITINYSADSLKDSKRELGCGDHGKLWFLGSGKHFLLRAGT